MFKFKVALLCACLMVSATNADEPVHQHQAGMNHAVTAGSDSLPTETGQSAFAAIQEIVAKLEADPGTDWSTVNIEALRQHLIDMDLVTTQASVVVEKLDDGRRFSVTGVGPVADAIQRMAAGHAATMNGVGGWTFIAKTLSNGAALTAKPPSTDQLGKLDALGFIGVMTLGMHHQEHHWMIAKGGQPHHN